MGSKTISVIIPTYNRATLICETLESVFAQGIACEVIVVDDGSTDNTIEVLQNSRSEIKVIQIANSGDLVARNRGLLEARGDLVAFCDSDDVWERGYLGAMLQQWEAYPGLVSCYSNFRIWRDGKISRSTKLDDAPVGFWEGFKQTNSCGGVFEAPIVDRLINFQPLFTSCMVADRNALIKLGGWDEGVSRIVGCDFATALRMGNAPPIGLMTGPAVLIRKHSESISSDVEKMNLGDAQVLEYILATRPAFSKYATELKSSISKRRGEAIDSAFARRDYATFLKHYRQLLPEDRTAKRILKRAISAALSLFT